MSIFHQNIKSLTHKIDHMMFSISETEQDNNTPIDVICLTEHHLKYTEIILVSIKGFILCSHCCRSIRKKGGVATIVANNLKFCAIDTDRFKSGTAF